MLDFIHVPVAVRQGVWPRAIAGLDDDPWAAALVAHHARVVYGRFHGDPAWTSFFDRLDSERHARRRASGLTLEALEAGYRYLRAADLISLMFCTASADTHQFADWTLSPSGSRVVVTPDPFGGEVVPMAIQARLLVPQRFASGADLRDQLRQAPVVTIRGTVAGDTYS